MVKAIILPLLRLTFFTALVKGGFLWLEQSHQIYVDRWVATMIGAAESMADQAPNWVGWVLTGLGGFVCLGIWEIVKRRRSRSSQRACNFEITLNEFATGESDDDQQICWFIATAANTGPTRSALIGWRLFITPPGVNNKIEMKNIKLSKVNNFKKGDEESETIVSITDDQALYERTAEPIDPGDFQTGVLMAILPKGLPILPGTEIQIQAQDVFGGVHNNSLEISGTVKETISYYPGLDPKKRSVEPSAHRSIGIRSRGKKVSLKHLLILGHSTGIDSEGDNLQVEDTIIYGSEGIGSQSAADRFISTTEGSEDFHLKSDKDAVDHEADQNQSTLPKKDSEDQ